MIPRFAGKETMSVRDLLLAAVLRGRDPPSSPPSVRPSHIATTLPPCLWGLSVEDLELHSDPDAQSPSQTWVPLRIVQPPGGSAAGNVTSLRRPVVLMLHATNSSKDFFAEHQASYARRGFLSAAVDARYHGTRTDAALGYQSALSRAWRDGQERPFLLDNIYDLRRVLDYLETRSDVDMKRVGTMGISLGGMHTWLLAVADPRITAAAPILGVQSFKYAVDFNRYQARVNSIPEVFATAAKELRGDARRVDADVVRAVFDRLLPGLLECYDAPESLPSIAPRPLLVVNGAEDPRCPLEGVNRAMDKAKAAYSVLGAEASIRLFAQPGVGHQCTVEMLKEVETFFDATLLHSTAT